MNPKAFWGTRSQTPPIVMRCRSGGNAVRVVGESVRTKKRTEITIETERVIVIRRRRLPVHAWCQPCGGQVVMVTVDEAARAACVSARTVYRWVEDEKLHFIETAEGGLLICQASIPPSGPVVKGD